MSLAIDIVLAGVVLGGMYALVAMGLTLQYGVARIMNLSHGESLIAAALRRASGALTAFAVSPLIGLIVAIPLGFAINWLIYQIVLMPLVRRAKNRAMLEVDSILATFGLLFVVQGIMLVTVRRAVQHHELPVDPGERARLQRRAQPADRARLRADHRHARSISR